VQGREVEVGEGEISLGRSQSANVSVKDASVSRNHALMQAKSGRLTVKDLNSSNGTFLNGMRIFAEAELHDVMRQTRHKSVEVARRYMRSADLWRNNVTEKVMRHRP